MTTRQDHSTQNRPANMGSSMDDQATRLDGVAKVTGHAKYGRDMYLPNSLFAAFIRCPFGNATLESHDKAAAMAVPGVVEVEMTGDRGMYEGHVVGHLAADSLHAMRRGLRALNTTWKRDSVDTTIEDGIDGNPSVPSGAQGTLDGADHVIEAVYSTQVQTHSSLETHGASIDHRGDSATAYVSTQGTFAARDGLDGAIGLPRAKYEVVCEYVGGGFGSKLNGAGKEGVLAAKLGAKYTRPVYVFVNRAEDHLDTGNRPSSRAYVKMGCKNDGTPVGGFIQTWGGVGVGRGGGGVRIPSQRYELGSVERNHADIRFNAGAPRAFRAPGSPQGAFVEELMLDEMATVAGVDPVDLRIRIDTDDDRKAMYEMGAKLIGWGDRQKTGSQSGVMRRGFGVGSASWGRFPSQTEAEVVIHRDGSIEARTGTQDIGTGQRTAMGIVAADSLGVFTDMVDVNIGRSTLPVGPGSGGSVTAHNSAPAMASAAEDAKQKMLTRLADVAGIDASELDIDDGAIKRHGQQFMSWAEACGRLGVDSVTGRGRWDRRTRGADRSTGHSHGVQFVDLEVDSETGVVHVHRVVAIQACGKVICRKTAESQVIGGVIQGLSYALYEDKILDPTLGSMVNPNLETYKILGTRDMPSIEPILWTKGQTGVRSLGEPPTIPTSGAVACAVLNAIGAPVRHLPLTPDKVLAAMGGDA